jgi:hypothetical protein
MPKTTSSPALRLRWRQARVARVMALMNCSQMFQPRGVLAEWDWSRATNGGNGAGAKKKAKTPDRAMARRTPAFRRGILSNFRQKITNKESATGEVSEKNRGTAVGGG